VYIDDEGKINPWKILRAASQGEEVFLPNL